MKYSLGILHIVFILSVQIVRGIDITTEVETDDLVSCIRHIFRNGMPFLFGPIDPYDIDKYVWSSESHWISGNYEFDRISFTGISKFYVQSVYVTNIETERVFRINCKLAINLKLTGSYNVPDGILFDVGPLKGTGNFTLKTSPVELDLTMNFDSKCEGIKCFKDAHLGIRTNAIVDITGLEPNARMSSLISRQVQSIIDVLFNHNAEIVNTYLDPLLNKFILTLTNIKVPPALQPIVNAYLHLVWKSCSKQFHPFVLLLKHQ